MDTKAKLVLSAKCIIPNAIGVAGAYLVRISARSSAS